MVGMTKVGATHGDDYSICNLIDSLIVLLYLTFIFIYHFTSIQSGGQRKTCATICDQGLIVSS